MKWQCGLFHLMPVGSVRHQPFSLLRCQNRTIVKSKRREPYYGKLGQAGPPSNRLKCGSCLIHQSASIAWIRAWFVHGL
jgi:hypothetical protein